MTHLTRLVLNNSPMLLINVNVGEFTFQDLLDYLIIFTPPPTNALASGQL